MHKLPKQHPVGFKTSINDDGEDQGAGQIRLKTEPEDDVDDDGGIQNETIKLQGLEEENK